MSKHEFANQNSKTETKVKAALLQGIEVPSPEKIPKKEEVPIQPFLEKRAENEMKAKIVEPPLEKKKLLTPKATLLTQDELNRKLSEETARYNKAAATSQAKLKSDEFFLQRRKEKIKQSVAVKDASDQKHIEDVEIQTPEEQNEELVEIKRGNFNPIYQRASMAVELDEKTANMEEIKGLERETLEGNKVMVEWINKNKNTLEKSQKFEPVLKKKDTQDVAFEELEKQAMKKIEEKISSYLTQNKGKVAETTKEEKNISNFAQNKNTIEEPKKNLPQAKTKVEDAKKEDKSSKNIEKKAEAQLEKKQAVLEAQDKKQKLPLKSNNEEKKSNSHKNSKEEEPKKEKDKSKVATSNNRINIQKPNNLKKNGKKGKEISNLESPAAREAALQLDIKRSKTPNHEQHQLKHKELVQRAKTPEYKTSGSNEKYFISKKKLEAQTQKAEVKNNMNQENILDNYTDEKFYQINNVFDESLNEITVKSLQTLKNFIQTKGPTTDICESLFGLLCGSIDEIPHSFISSKGKDPKDIQKILASPFQLLEGLKHFKKSITENKIGEANIFFALDILNSLPSLETLQGNYNTLVLETLKRLNSIIENACEFYKISQQKNIHKEINKQIKEDEDQFINKPIPEEIYQKPIEIKTVSSEKRSSQLRQMNTIEVADEASNNLANLIKEFEKKEQNNGDQHDDIKKKLIQQAKIKEEQKPKSPPESHFKKKVIAETPSRLDQILKISAKKPEVESIIKLYLNKSGELKDLKEEGLMKSQKMVQEEIKKTKKNLQELTQKNNKLAWQEERELKKHEIEEERRRTKQEIERQYELESKFKEYVSQKEKKEKDAEKQSKLELHQTIKDKKELENLKEQIRIKEDYMKTLEEGQWKEHKKKLEEIEKKLNTVEKNPGPPSKHEKILKDLDDKNKQDYKNNLMSSAWAYQDLMNQKEQLEKALKTSVLLSQKKLSE